LLVAAALVFSGCVGPQPALRPLEGDDVTIFVHGYRGGFLKSADGDGVVLSTCTHPPAPITATLVESMGEHSAMPSARGAKPNDGSTHCVCPSTSAECVARARQERDAERP